MNFLSHFYFERDQANSYFVLGTLLPDLIKNADKNWNIHPEKNKQLFTKPEHLSLYQGYQKHLAVDRLFHNSEFFKVYQNRFKNKVKLALKDSIVKPFFIGHIALELLLDHILMIKKLIDVDLLYKHLNSIEDDILQEFLILNNIEDSVKFLNFYSKFKTEQYLYSYLSIEKISYAIKRICMRIWLNPFTLAQEEALTNSLKQCKIELSKEFISIFDRIESELN